MTNLKRRLAQLETDVHDDVRRLTADLVATLNRELSIPERRAFCRVAERVQALRSAGVPCPMLPSGIDATAHGDGVRLPGGELLATNGEEWALYRRAAARVRELWEARGGPDIDLGAE